MDSVGSHFLFKYTELVQVARCLLPTASCDRLPTTDVSRLFTSAFPLYCVHYSPRPELSACPGMSHFCYLPSPLLFLGQKPLILPLERTSVYRNQPFPKSPHCLFAFSCLSLFHTQAHTTTTNPHASHHKSFGPPALPPPPPGIWCKQC